MRIGSKLLLAWILLLLSAVSFAQDANVIAVTGVVKDEKGNLLPSITVTEKGSRNMSVTNERGVFAFQVKPDATLEFTGVGFEKRELKVSGKTNFTVTMNVEVKSLSDVVVVGYGTQKKANLTGAVDQVSGEILDNRPITRVTQGLQGVIGNLNITTNTNGGTPNATQSINIRGYTGFGSLASPLIVIDGVTASTSMFNNLNPNDIESISVLKDLASAAIYGVDGVNGVILVTTKTGKKNQKPQITYSNVFDYSKMINLPHLVSSLEWAETMNEAARNAGVAEVFQPEQMQRIRDYIDGKLTTETQPNATGTGWVSGNGNNDWFKVIFKDFAVNQQHNLGVSGGSNASSYYLGASINDKKGMFRYGNDEYKRYNFRANLSTNIKDYLKFSFRSSYTKTNYNTPYEYPGATGGGLAAYLHNAARAWPSYALYLPDGSFAPNGSLVPLMASGARSITDGDELQMTGEFVISPLKGWDITANYSFFTSNSSSIANSVPIKTPNPDGSMNIALSPGSISRTLGGSNTHQVNIYSTYEKRLSDHLFKLTGGYTGRQSRSLSMSGSNTNLYTDNLPALVLTYGTTPSLSDAIEANAVAGYFGRLNYSFRDKYLLEFNGRYDATSRFIYNRWAFFPGVSAGYVVSNEKFWEPIHEYVNSFKLRASYGKSGDQGNVSGNYPFYPSLPTVKATSANWYFGTATQASVSQAGDINPNITWAQPVMLNLGVDMTFLKNRLNITAEGYRKTIKDLLVGSQPLPAVYGTSAPQINAGEMYTQGFEATAAWQDRTKLFGKELKFSFRGIISNYNGYITKYPNPTKLLTTFYEGQKLGEIWGYEAYDLYRDSAMLKQAPKSASFYAGKWTLGDVYYLDQNGDSILNTGRNTADSSGDRRIIGNSTPRFTYSFNMNFEYRGFDLNIYLQGVAKRDVFISSNYFFGIADGTSNFQNSIFTSTRDRWTPTNPDGYLPKFYLNATNSRNQQVSTRYLQNAAYLRVKSVQLGYTLPADLLSRVKVQRLRVYASAENLATISKMWKGIDPEIAIGTAKIYPLQQSFAFGLNLTL